MPNRKLLSFFTPPYPEECLYSVAARYHARSANPHPAISFRELFPSSKTSFANAITTTYYLTNVSHWAEPSLGYTCQSVARNHTAYQFNSIRYTRITDTDNDRLGCQYTQMALKHPHNVLRYCPHCAREQKKIYGEPYWQRLPQLYGAEYCPIHAVPYEDSTVTFKSAGKRLYTASLVLSENAQNHAESQPDPLAEVYFNASKDLHWLLQHGLRVKGLFRNLDAIERLCSLPHKGLFGRTIEQLALDHFPQDFVYHGFPALKNPSFSYSTLSLRSLKPRQLMILMRISAGNAEKFARKREALPVKIINLY